MNNNTSVKCKNCNTKSERKSVICTCELTDLFGELFVEFICPNCKSKTDSYLF